MTTMEERFRQRPLEEKIEALTKERDALAANHKECVRCLGEALQDTTKLAVERDALALGVDQWKVDFHELRLERDALAAAAKLALDALDSFAEWENMSDPQRPATEAIAALRQAGVQ